MISQIPCHWLIWTASRQDFFLFYLVGDHNVRAVLIHCLLHWNMTNRNVISTWLTMQTTTVAESRAGVCNCWKRKLEQIKPSRQLGLTKSKPISPSTASLQQESKWPCKFLHVKTQLGSYVLHGNQESELYSKGNSWVICQSLKPINFRNTDELIFSPWQVDTFYLLLSSKLSLQFISFLPEDRDVNQSYFSQG